MFGRLIYYDKNRISEYTSLVTGKKSMNITGVELKKDKGVGINLPVLNGDANSSTSYTATFNESFLYDCNEFEKLLEGRDDYFNYVDAPSESYSITTMKRGYIIRFESNIIIPENFDIIQLMEQFKPMILEGASREMPEEEKAAFKTLFGSTEIKIPIMCEIEDIPGCSKIDSMNLLVEYSQLEEYERENVIVLARIVSNSLISKNTEIYEPLKDFINMNRSLRRQFAENRPVELNQLYCDEDYIRLEILAVYE